MTDNYNRLKEAAAHYDTKPIVAWTLYDAPSQYNNNTGTYILSNASYKVGLTKDAGEFFFFLIVRVNTSNIDTQFSFYIL